MPRKRKHQERHIRVRGVRRKEVDIRKLGQALIALAQAQSEKDAEIDHRRRANGQAKKRRASGD